MSKFEFYTFREMLILACNLMKAMQKTGLEKETYNFQVGRDGSIVMHGKKSNLYVQVEYEKHQKKYKLDCYSRGFNAWLNKDQVRLLCKEPAYLENLMNKILDEKLPTSIDFECDT